VVCLAAGKHLVVGCPHVLDDFGGSSSLSCIPMICSGARNSAAAARLT
jgi:hypothetical protein